jgi:hypothetical protein
LVEESNEAQNEKPLEDSAAQYPELEGLRSSKEKAIQALRERKEEDDKQIDKSIKEWASYEAANVRNEDRIHIARLWQRVLQNEKVINGLDLVNTEGLFDLTYLMWSVVWEIADYLEQRFARTLTKEEAQALAKEEAENFGRFLLHRIQRREAEARKRWINGKLGRGAT